MTESKRSGLHQRRDRLMHEHIHDTYKIRSKLAEPAVCPECRAIYRQGRWQWAESWPEEIHQEVCPACHRIKDRYPAGILTLTGAFVQKHKTELLDRVRHLEAEEKRQHPLGRIMGIEEHPGLLSSPPLIFICPITSGTPCTLLSKATSNTVMKRRPISFALIGGEKTESQF